MPSTQPHSAVTETTQTKDRTSAHKSTTTISTPEPQQQSPSSGSATLGSKVKNGVRSGIRKCCDVAVAVVEGPDMIWQ
jgi:hypothetical protein